MTDLVIRAATADDVPAISALVQHTVRISNGRDYPPQAIEMIVANFAPAKVGQRMAERDVFVCQKGDRIVGTIALGGDRLRSLFVDPELQQAGIGARLVGPSGGARAARSASASSGSPPRSPRAASMNGWATV